MDAKYVSKKLYKMAERLEEIVSMFRELDDLQTERMNHLSERIRMLEDGKGGTNGDARKS